MANLFDVALRLRAFRALLPGLAARRVAQIGERVAGELADAAPRGAGPAPHLADSFASRAEGSGADLRAVVMTTMGRRFRYVVYGTGIYGQYHARVVPTTKKALWWPGAEHPYSSVAGQRPNDFARPVLERQKSPVEIELLAQDVRDAL